jgi:hypothetical protein
MFSSRVSIAAEPTAPDFGESVVKALLVRVHAEFRNEQLPHGDTGTEATQTPGAGQTPSAAELPIATEARRVAETTNTKAAAPPLETSPPGPIVEATEDGVGIVVSRSSPGEVIVLTTLHTVFNGTRFADVVTVRLSDTNEPIPATPITLNAGNQAPPDEYDAVLLRVPTQRDFTWPGFRRARTLRPEEKLKMPLYTQAGGVVIRERQFAGIRVHPNLRLRADGEFRDGYSGTPVFDKDWKLVGMVITAEGLLTPADNLELLMLGHGQPPNLQSLASARKQLDEEARKYEEAQYVRLVDENDGFTRFGLVRISSDLEPPAGPPMYGGRIALTGGIPFVATAWGFGAGLVGGVQLTGGYQSEVKGFGEFGAEAGGYAFLGARRNFLLSLTWSPSILLFKNETPEFVLMGGAATVNVQVGTVTVFTKSWYLGVELRSVNPYQSRPNFVESCTYVAFAHE